MTRLLNGVLTLHDVTDVEALVRRALHDQLRATQATLPPHEHDDATAYLIATCWELAQRYDPTRARPGHGKTSNFATWAYRILRRRIADWYRTRHGDSRYYTIPELQTLDTTNPRLDSTHPTSPRDPQTDRTPDLTRILNRRPSQTPWTVEELDRETPSRAPRRTRVSGR